jgi:hypothetical protein
MLATLFILAGVIASIAACVLYFTLKNAPDGHEDPDGFHIDEKSKSGYAEAKQSKSCKQRRRTTAGKPHLDAA